jgi:uncharacterized protein (TIGR00369 family)
VAHLPKRANPSRLPMMTGSKTAGGTDKLEELRELMLRRIPFNSVLGIQIVELSPGRATLAIPFRPELVGDPVRPALHGGVISALADTCGGCTVWSAVGDGDRVSTIDLRVDYLRPGKLEDLHATGVVLRVGNRVGVTTISLFHPSQPDELVAEAKGVYSVKRA